MNEDVGMSAFASLTKTDLLKICNLNTQFNKDEYSTNYSVFTVLPSLFGVHSKWDSDSAGLTLA